MSPDNADDGRNGAVEPSDSAAESPNGAPELADGTELTGTTAYLLGRVGSEVTDRYAAAVATHGVRPKHVGLIAALAQWGPSAQLDLARALGVAPSLMVALADNLEEQGAITRTRDADDRRRQLLELTPVGRQLLRRCTAEAEQVSRQLTAGLSTVDRDRLHLILFRLFADLGLNR